MKALSLWQPYASLIAVGIKHFETRCWAPPSVLVGSRIAIHAAKRRPTRDDVLMQSLAGAVEIFGRADWADVLPYGAIVCTAVLRGAYKTGAWDRDVSAAVTASVGVSWPRTKVTIDDWGDFSPGRWAWKLAEIRLVEPAVPIRGARGIFDVDDGLLA